MRWPASEPFRPSATTCPTCCTTWLVTPDTGESMYEMLGRSLPVVEIPEAGHHAMLDQPLVLTTAIRTLLADWDHSMPRARAQED